MLEKCAVAFICGHSFRVGTCVKHTHPARLCSSTSSLLMISPTSTGKLEPRTNSGILQWSYTNCRRETVNNAELNPETPGCQLPGAMIVRMIMLLRTSSGCNFKVCAHTAGLLSSFLHLYLTITELQQHRCRMVSLRTSPSHLFMEVTHDWLGSCCCYAKHVASDVKGRICACMHVLQ